MSDTPALSNSAKKNKKRKEKQHNAAVVKSSVAEGDTSPRPPQPIIAPPHDPKAILKKQIEEAKAVGDSKKAQQLREQLWLLQDTLTLGKPGQGAPQLDLTILAPPPSNPSPAGSVGDPLERSLGKLRKKMTQIEELRAKRDRGETLDANQLAKIERSKEVEEEIALLEEQQRSLQLR